MSTIVIIPKRKKGKKGKQRGGFLPQLAVANQLAKTIKPASIASSVIDVLGKRDKIAKNKFGKLLLGAIDFGKKQGYGRKRRVGRPRRK